MTKENLVSIIVPVFKAEAYLERCIKSIQNQTHKNIEIILVDDGSPDGSPAICDAFAKDDKRIKVVHKPNGGVSSARNTGLEIATGKYVCFIDSDDEVLENYCESMLKDLIDHNAEMVISPFIRIENGKEKILKAIENPVALNVKTEAGLKTLLQQSNWQGPCNKLYLRKKIENNFPLNIQYGEDSLFNLDYIKNINTVVLSNVATYKYYKNDNSLCTTNALYLYKKHTAIIDYYYKRFSKLFPENDSLAKHFSTYPLLSNLYFTLDLMLDQKYSTKKILAFLKEMFEHPDVQKSLKLCDPQDKKSKLVFKLFSKKKFRTLILFAKIYSALKK